MNGHKGRIGSLDDETQSRGFSGAGVVTEPVDALAFCLVGVGPDECKEILLRGFRLLVFLLAFSEEDRNEQDNKQKKAARSFHGLSSLAFRLNFRAAKRAFSVVHHYFFSSSFSSWRTAAAAMESSPSS